MKRRYTLHTTVLRSFAVVSMFAEPDGVSLSLFDTHAVVHWVRQ